MENNRKSGCWFVIGIVALCGFLWVQSASGQESVQENTIGVTVNSADGTYTIFDPSSRKPILTSRVAAQVDHHWLRSSDYPQHASKRESMTDELGPGTQLTVSNTGLAGRPDLIYSLQLHSDPACVTVTVK